MQTGYFLIFFVLPIFLEGCCVGNKQKKRTGLQENTTHLHYRAVEGEMFMMPCIKSMKGHMKVAWSRTAEGEGGTEGPSFDCDKVFSAEIKHSGTYTDPSGGSKLFFYLQVVQKERLGCFHPDESWGMLVNGAGGEIPCPGRNCSDNTDVRWYKGNRVVSEQRRASCEQNGLLHLCQVGEPDTGVYFCDRKIIEQGIMWTFRRAVNIRVIPHYKPSYRPRIVVPESNMAEEVELGQSHTLMCKVYFPFEINVSAVVRWYMNYGGNMENMTRLHMEKPQQKTLILEETEVIQSAIIKEVTSQHLNHTYTCIASNTVGNSAVTIKLKKKIKVKWPSLVGYPIVSLLVLAGLGIVLHVKWLELQLIYRSHIHCGKRDREDKEFDVFLSYVWSHPSAEADGCVSLSPQSGPDTDEEACLSSMNPLNTKEGQSTQTPLEVLLPRVLEERWGYHLCLLERDVLPGGAYTNDVVLAIQRSRMLICLLSADYLCNSNAVFVLESGVQALLQNSALKLLLIWTNRASASLIQPNPPLPTLVQKALKVLPSLDWTSGKSARATCNFWRSLRRAMPNCTEKNWFSSDHANDLPVTSIQYIY
uniref:Interleukin-18 receptor accessory protein-like n=1 Tax=Monopterus albus TaxID=43700 RepID=A0A3Q3JJG6_MONAL|nr:interleukin-18 receptor accessory protein-like [Monopterus albus]